jgi:hypothetical protein
MILTVFSVRFQVTLSNNVQRNMTLYNVMLANDTGTMLMNVGLLQTTTTGIRIDLDPTILGAETMVGITETILVPHLPITLTKTEPTMVIMGDRETGRLHSKYR